MRTRVCNAYLPNEDRGIKIVFISCFPFQGLDIWAGFLPCFIPVKILTDRYIYYS